MIMCSVQQGFPALGDDLRRVCGIGLREPPHPRQWRHRGPLQGAELLDLKSTFYTQVVKALNKIMFQFIFLK